MSTSPGPDNRVECLPGPASALSFDYEPHAGHMHAHIDPRKLNELAWESGVDSGVSPAREPRP